MNRHTPGPWVPAKPEHNVYRWEVQAGGGKLVVARIPTPRVYDGGAEADANAKLIAAAPDLLDTLRRTTEMLEWHRERAATGDAAREELDEAVNAAHAAIARAEG